MSRQPPEALSPDETSPQGTADEQSESTFADAYTGEASGDAAANQERPECLHLRVLGIESLRVVIEYPAFAGAAAILSDQGHEPATDNRDAQGAVAARTSLVRVQYIQDVLTKACRKTGESCVRHE